MMHNTYSPPLQQFVNVFPQNEELRKLEQMEKELSNILENAEQSDFETVYRIYSNIINNAELASKQIDSHDPLKK